MSRFNVDLSNMSEVRQLVPVGEWPLRITKAEVKTGKSKKDESKSWMAINFVFTVRDQEVQKLLGQDEPKIYESTFISLDENDNLSMSNNPTLGSILAACGLKSEEADAKFAEGIDEDAENFEGWKQYVSNICEAIVGYDILGKVTHRPKEKGSEDMVTSISKFAALD